MSLRRFSRCHRKGHDWFPGLDRSEFLPLQDVCLRCSAERMLLPYGQCLGGHLIAEHYLHGDTTPRPAGNCAGPS